MYAGEAAEGAASRGADTVSAVSPFLMMSVMLQTGLTADESIGPIFVAGVQECYTISAVLRSRQFFASRAAGLTTCVTVPVQNAVDD